MHDLTALKVAKLGPGKHRVSSHLYLCVQPSGGRSWSYRYMAHGQSREMGLGPCDLVSLSEARDRVTDYRRALRSGNDPFAKRQADTPAVQHTFSVVAHMVHEIDHNAGLFSNPRYAKQWLVQLEQHVFPTIGDKPVNLISYDDAERVFKPIWTTLKNAAVIRGRCEKIIDYAMSHDWHDGPNPFEMKGGLGPRLGDRSKAFKTENHPSLPWQEIPAFLFDVGTDDVITKALRFLILTGTRSEECLAADWSEIDLDQAVWTIPAKRMKAEAEHQVPLAPAALDLLRSLSGRSGPVFAERGKRLNKDVLLKRTRERANGRTGVGTDRVITVHGFRASLQTYGLEHGFPEIVCDMALAHTQQDAVKKAYTRGSLFSQRKALMEQWAAYCMK